MDFQKSVIDRSHEIPVVVDFWAPWCGPCQYLGPILDNLASQDKDIWELVKINVDDNQEISTRFGIRGIPAVKLFYQGEIIADFSGALPKTAIQKWLNEHLPSADKDQLEEILAQTKEIPDQSLIDNLQSYISKNPDNALAKVELAKHLAFISPNETSELLSGIKLGNDLFDMVNHIRHFSQFMISEYGSSEVGQKLEEAKFDLIENDLESGIQKLIDANSLDKNYLEDLPRVTTIALFEILGKEHALTRDYRWKFDMVLY